MVGAILDPLTAPKRKADMLFVVSDGKYSIVPYILTLPYISDIPNA